MNDASEVKLHFLYYWRIIKVRAGLIALAFLLVMVTAGVTTYFLPRQYFSKVTLEVKPDKSGPVSDILAGQRARAEIRRLCQRNFRRYARRRSFIR